MLAFLYALVTGPIYGLVAMLRGFLWVLGLIFCLLLFFEVPPSQWPVYILLAIAFLILQFLMTFAIAREALEASGGGWTIHRDVSWLKAAGKFFGASLLGLLWLIFVIVATVFGLYLVGYRAPENVEAWITVWATQKALAPDEPVEGYELLEFGITWGPYVFQWPLAVFTTTYVAASAGNGLLTRNGWTIGYGTMRMLAAAILYTWLAVELDLLIKEVSKDWDAPLAVSVGSASALVISWAFLMGCAAQIYRMRREREEGPSEEELRAFDDGFKTQRETDARSLRKAWMSDGDDDY